MSVFSGPVQCPCEASLSLNSSGAVAAHELFHLGTADAVEIPKDAVLQAGSGHGKFQRLLQIVIMAESINQSAGKAVAAADTVHNIPDLIAAET